MAQRITVWDLPTRVFHWALVLSFFGAYLSAESERWRPIHIALGYTVLGLMIFRIIWGFTGTRYARFAEFVRAPQVIMAYVRSMIAGQPARYLGHNPLGALAILLLIGLGLLSGVSGWRLDAGGDNEMWEELHESVSNGMLLVVFLHVAGVIYSSLKHRENLVVAMITGKKSGLPEEGIANPRRWIGLALMVVASGVGIANGVSPEKYGNPPAGESGSEPAESDEDDDD